MVESNPVNGKYWDQLGITRYNAQKYISAITAYEKVLDLRAGYPFYPAYNIACCEALLGEKDKALKWLTRAMEMGFRDLQKVQTDNDLKSLHGDARFTELAAIKDVSQLSRDEGWRYDLWLLTREAKRIHYKPLIPGAAHAVDAFAKNLHDGIPRLTDNQIKTGFMHLMSLFSDGHSGIHISGPSPALPVQFFLFQEGLFITNASLKYRDLSGSQVLRIGSHSITEVLASLEPVISRDNSMWPTLIGPNLLRDLQVLNGLGLIPDGNKINLTIRDLKGVETDVTIQAETGESCDNWITARNVTPGPEPLYLKNRKALYWFEYLP